MWNINKIKAVSDDLQVKIKRKYNRKHMIFVAAAFGLIGAITLLLSLAASPYLSLEPESGTLTAPAATGADTNASGGSYVQFGTVSTPPPPPSGTTYYVDCSAGSDTNAGTQAAPWKTISKANAASIPSGGGLLFKKQPTGGCNYGSGLIVKWTGVTVSNYGSGNLPLFSTTSTSNDIITVNGNSNIIDGLEIAGPDIKTVSNDGVSGTMSGILLNAGASNNTVQNSTISGNYAGIYLHADATQNKILHNIIHDNKLLNSGGSAGAFGVLLHGNNNTISYNDFSSNYADSILYPPYDGSSVEVYTGDGESAASNNVISYNKSVNDNAFSELGKGKALTTPIPDNNTFAYNSYTASGQSNALFINTRGTVADGYGPITHTNVYNNSAYITDATKSAALICYNTCDATNLVYYNNILISSGGGASVSGAPGSNNITGTTASAAGYVNAPTDLHLTSTSPAINAGNNIAFDLGFKKDLDGHTVPAGTAVDIGAYEYGSVAFGGSSGSFSASNQIARVGKFFKQTFASIVASLGHFLGSLLKPLTANAATTGDPIVAAVGDIQGPGNTGAPRDVSNVVDTFGATAILGLGDYQYSTSPCSQYLASNSYDSYWGPRQNSKMYTTFGPTHDYDTNTSTGSDATSYFNGACKYSDGTPQAGPKSAGAIAVSNGASSINGGGAAGLTWKTAYSFDIGSWHIISLPSLCYRYGGSSSPANSVCDTGTYNNTTKVADTGIAKWLKDDLAAHTQMCQIAYWHEAYFTSTTSSHPATTIIKPWVQELYDAGVDVVLSGHNHDYERFNPQNPDNVADSTNGITAFVVGTGGIGFYTFGSNPIAPNSAKRTDNTYGALKLTLHPTSFDYQFVTTAKDNTGALTLAPFDTSTTSVNCHGKPGSSTNPDTTAPNVDAITSPTPSQVITSSTVTVSGTASDPTVSGQTTSGLNKVEYSVDNPTPTTWTQASGTTNWTFTTSALANGPHTVYVRATDNAGLPSAVKSVSFSVSSCASPAPTTQGKVTLSTNVAAAGNYRVWARIWAPDTTNNSVYFQDGCAAPIKLGDSSSISPNQWVWVNYQNGNSSSFADLTNVTAGTHNIVISGDEAGVRLDRILMLSTTDSCVPTGNGDICTLAPDSTPPITSVINPANNATGLTGNITVTASASDPAPSGQLSSGLKMVEVCIDNKTPCSQMTPPATTGGNWTYLLDTKTLDPKISHSLFSRATDNSTPTNLSTNSTTVNFTVADQVSPVTQITTPANNSTFGNTTGQTVVGIGATYSDNVAVTKQVFSIDGTDVQTITPNSPSGTASYSWNVSTLTNKAYTIKSTVYDAANNPVGTYTITVNVNNDKTPPVWPSNALTGTAVSSTQVNLSWLAADNTTVSYQVRRSGTVITPTLPASQLTYNDTTAVSGTSYDYVIIATDAYNNTSLSNTFTVTPPPPPPPSDTTKPSVPTGLSATAPSNTQVNLSWTASTDNVGGTGVAGYNVYRDGAKINGSTLVTSTTFGDTNLTPGSTHSYTVTAVDGAGNESSPSSPASITLPQNDTTAPTISVTSPTGTQTLKGTVPVSATASDPTNISGQVSTGLAKIELYIDGSSTAAQTSTTGTLNYSWNTSGLNGSHSLLILAYDKASPANIGRATVNVTLDNTAPTTSITAPAAGLVKATQTITASSSDNVGVTKTEIYINGSLAATATSYSWNTFSVTDGAYTITSKAYDAVGNIGTSPPITVTVDNIAPSTPGAFTATASGQNQINLSWQSSNDTNGIKSYQLLREGIVIQTLPATATSFNDTGLLAGTLYHYSLIAVDNVGNNSVAATASATTQVPPPPSDTTKPFTPTGLTAAVDTTIPQVNLSWQATTDNPSGPIAGYNVYRDGTKLNGSTLVTSTTLGDSSVTAGSTYAYTVTAVDGAGNESDKSSPASATIPGNDTTPPTVTIISPADGVSVNQGTPLSVSVTAYDTSGILRCSLYVDGVYNQTSSSSSNPYVFSLATGSLSVADHKIYGHCLDNSPATNRGDSAQITIHITSTTPPPPPINTLNFTPTDDAGIKQRYASTNYGSSTNMKVDASPVENILMKFNITGVNGRVVKSAKLRLYDNNPSPSGGKFHRVVNNSWNESSVTWNNAPAGDSTILATLGSVSKGAWYEVDLTALFTGDGVYSIRMDSASGDGAQYNTSEASSNRPQLILTVQ